MRKFLSLTLIFVVVLTALCIVPASASIQITVRVNDNMVSFPDALPYTDSAGRTMVPVRFVSEELGSTVDWDNPSQTATITSKDGKNTVKVTLYKKTYSVNGVTKTMDTQAVSKDGRTFVPIRFISEGLGAFVDWDNTLKRVQVINTLDSATLQRLRSYPLGKIAKKYYSNFASANEVGLTMETGLTNGTTRDIVEKERLLERAKKAMIIANDWDYRTIGDQWKKDYLDVFDSQATVKDRNGNTVPNSKWADMFIQEVKDNTGVEDAEFITDSSLIYDAHDDISFTVRGVFIFRTQSPTNLNWIEVDGNKYGQWYEVDVDVQLTRLFLDDYTFDNCIWLGKAREIQRS